ncbi:hypothetical protein BDR06DRAFT_959200 [Suillus hirtellus]|nr:hypothetical protein BDR06DRAFT_959200 [Suillus hirtellus]
MIKDPSTLACYRNRYCGVVDGSTPCCEYLWKPKCRVLVLRVMTRSEDISLHDDGRAIKKRTKER